MSVKFTRPVIFGEVLFDHYQDGSRHIGGAPFNVAWHLNAFGQRPLFISRIGQDEEGELVFMEMQQWGMDSLGVQIDPNHPTGRVQVIRNDRDVMYRIENNQAYDFISTALSTGLVRDRQASLVYTGTLALRNEQSRKSYQAICVGNDLPRFVDLNLRAPWWEADTIKQLLQGANWVKLNEDELRKMVKRDLASDTDLRMATDIFRRTFAIDHVFLTRGDRGACYCAHETWLNQKGPGIDLVDEVGAGDAFCAVCILGIQSGWNFSQILERATQFAATICGQHGATCKDRDVYAGMLEKWNK